jgi:hypothetical protein
MLALDSPTSQVSCFYVENPLDFFLNSLEIEPGREALFVASSVYLFDLGLMYSFAKRFFLSDLF